MGPHAASNVVFRISGKGAAATGGTDAVAADEHCSAPFSGASALLCAYERVVARASGLAAYRFVDTITGALLPRDAVQYPAIDTSGVLLAQDERGRVIALGSPDGARHALQHARDGEVPRSFRYGMCALWRDGRWRVVRFDAAPDVKAGRTRE